jgi:hypothetical protein
MLPVRICTGGAGLSSVPTATKYRMVHFTTVLLISDDLMTRLVFARSDRFENSDAFSTPC